MIFNDQVHVTLKEKQYVNGTATTVTIFDSLVPGIVNFVDSETGSDSKISSRLKIFLSPFAFAIPPMRDRILTLAWKQFTNLLVEGIAEPHYLNGRLHHYEIDVKSV